MSFENGTMAILIVSCDKYSDLWPAFFKLLKRNWEDCPFKMYIGSNQKICTLRDNTVETICVGEDRSWADNAHKMLENISEPYVLMLLEDFFIDKVVSTQEIKKRLQFMIENQADSLRLNPCPPPWNTIDKKLDIGEVEMGSPYCVSTQPAIWKKASLSKLMKPGYSAWDFEIKNSEHSPKYNMRFYASNHYVISHQNAVEQGKWYLSTLDLLKENGIYVDGEIRGIIDNKKLRRKFQLKKYRIREWFCIKLRLYRITIGKKQQ